MLARPTWICRRPARRKLKMPRSRKMPQRLPQPGLGRGRVQRAARRAAVVKPTLSTADVAEMAFVRKRLLHGRRLEPQDYRLVRRALALIAEPIGRASTGMGRPMIWRLKTEEW
jgi:hypothetical protein